MLYSAGQLHREVMERVSGKVGIVDTSVAWPTVETEQKGPVVMSYNNGKRFGSGEYPITYLPQGSLRFSPSRRFGKSYRR